MIERLIPSTGERLPLIGLGTWKAFDKEGSEALEPLKAVMAALQASGGKLVDASPMYGRAEKVVGDLTKDCGSGFFFATKVWTEGKEEGITQMEVSFRKMQRETMDLMQIHNLVDWKTHLPTLRKWKEEGRIRYIGITHYTDAAQAELERVLKQEPMDFVQLNYSIVARQAENRLLPMAADTGVATLINRPLLEGALLKKLQGLPLPAFAAELQIESWGQYCLKYILGHPAVTCAIPGTGNPQHMKDNAKAGEGLLPDEGQRRKMRAYLESL